MAVSKQELIDEIESVGKVTCTTEQGVQFDIGTSDNWVGGSENGFMCDWLGNVEYSSKESVVDAIFAYLGKDGDAIDEIDF